MQQTSREESSRSQQRDLNDLEPQTGNHFGHLPTASIADCGPSQRFLPLNGAFESEDDYSDSAMTNGESDSDEQEPLPASPPLLTVGDVQRALHPLQANADRVGKQVEQFAESLDRLGIKKPRKPQKDCRQVLPLVQAYKGIAHDAVVQLKRIHAPERYRKASRKSERRLHSSSGKSTPTQIRADEEDDIGSRTTIKDLEYWEQEEQTWDLLELMLQIEFPVSEAASPNPKKEKQFVRPKEGIEIHRYSTEGDIWTHFLAHDDLAWERHTVVEWLRKCAEGSRQDVNHVVQDLETEADRGSGLWAHSWLYSKEAIKGQKRLRSWPQVLEPDDPGLDTSLMKSDDTKSLVTQLDPDAVTRQGRNLEKHDHYFERATWLACWELVRRGKDWDSIREWCQERVEGWRAAAMRGDPRYSSSAEDSLNNSTSTATGWHSRALWRRACALAAKSGGMDQYENAVYGVLSGHLPSVLKVCHSWDDYLFAHYNSYLLRSFDRYVRVNFADRFPSTLLEKKSALNLSMSRGQRTQSGNQIIEKMKRLKEVRAEAKLPMKMLQGSLVAKNFDEFIFKHGVILSRLANSSEKSRILPLMNGKLLEGTITGHIGTENHDLLRVITHMLFIFQDLGLDIGDGDRKFATENFVVAYVDYLSKAGKQQLLPLYASRLSPQRATTCLGRQLPKVTDHGERQMMIRLMRQFGIDVPGVFNQQLQMIIKDTPPDVSHSKTYPTLHILEQSGDATTRVRAIENHFLMQPITADQEDLINGFEWYLLLDGHWQQTMTIGTILYKHLLRSKGLAAARVLSNSVPFSNLSIAKTPGLLGHTVDLGQDAEDSGGDDKPSRQHRRTRSQNLKTQPGRRGSSTKRAAGEREYLLSQARSFRDFEALFTALDTLENWRDLAERATEFTDPRKDGKFWKANFQMAYERVEEAMNPLLHQWLQYPKDDKEALEFHEIRLACLPEVILAYNTVLNFSAQYVSRNLLLKSMDLAALVAEEGSDLATSFVAAGRMPELVDSFANSSKNLIRAQERGASKAKKRLNGESLEIWAVQAPNAD